MRTETSPAVSGSETAKFLGECKSKASKDVHDFYWLKVARMSPRVIEDLDR